MYAFDALLGVHKIFWIQKIFVIFLNLSFKLIAKGLIIGNLIGISFSLIQLKFKILTLQKETYYLEFVPVNFDLFHVLLLNIINFYDRLYLT